MTTLLIDVGNTSAKYALIDEPNTPIRLVGFEEAKDSLHQVKKILCSAVSSNIEVQQLQTLSHCEFVFIATEAESFGVDNAYSKFQNLGVDRWLAILGAEFVYPNQNIVVVDAGTAMTVDVLDRYKKHQGGWIVPGLSLMQRAIVEKATGVFSDRVDELETFGTDTPSALFSGCMHALLSLIENAKYRLGELTGEPTAKVVITGGDANLLGKYLNVPHELIPDLVFKGLARYA